MPTLGNPANLGVIVQSWGEATQSTYSKTQPKAQTQSTMSGKKTLADPPDSGRECGRQAWGQQTVGNDLFTFRVVSTIAITIGNPFFLGVPGLLYKVFLFSIYTTIFFFSFFLRLYMHIRLHKHIMLSTYNRNYS